MTILNKMPKQVLALTLVLNQDLKLEIIRNMKRYGGSFVKCLADCILTADMKNLTKLVLTFDNYFREYLPEEWKK